MSSNWSALYARLVRSVNRHSRMMAFSELFPAEHPPSGFRDPARMLDWLHGRCGDRDARNAVLSRLLGYASGRAHTDLAVELLILALWPGLSVIRRRLLPFRETAVLEADLLAQVTVTIRQAHPSRIISVAATLLRNVERDLRRAYRKEVPGLTRAELATELTLRVATPDDAEAILKAAQAEFGADGVLVVAVHVAGFSQKDAGARLGLSHDAARKRCQRL
ncbi:hypothetical protein, partial [Tropicibacter sp. S64]